MSANSPPPANDGRTIVTSEDTMVCIVEGNEDTTIRPCPPNIPRHLPIRGPSGLNRGGPSPDSTETPKE